MRNGKELIGRPIYGITDGRQVGSVKDLFVDLELKLLKGVYLGREGLISRKIRFIARENIAVFGIDAVMTTQSDVIDTNSQVPEVDVWLRRDELQGREIETSGGTKVGTVGDLLFDEQAQVAGVSLSRVHVAGPIAEKKMVLRSAIIETGGREGAMIVDLSMAEKPMADVADSQLVEPEPKAEASEAPPAGTPETQIETNDDSTEEG
jgi:uncharacterized protein YrrD